LAGILRQDQDLLPNKSCPVSTSCLELDVLARLTRSFSEIVEGTLDMPAILVLSSFYKNISSNSLAITIVLSGGNIVLK